jgi:hypothetical protein
MGASISVSSVHFPLAQIFNVRLVIEVEVLVHGAIGKPIHGT